MTFPLVKLLDTVVSSCYFENINRTATAVSSNTEWKLSQMIDLGVVEVLEGGRIPTMTVQDGYVGLTSVSRADYLATARGQTKDGLFAKRTVRFVIVNKSQRGLKPTCEEFVYAGGKLLEYVNLDARV